jgi:outer membrane lipoprotein-sorting protein
MKTRKFLFSAILMFLSITSLRAQTADEIINKHLDAIGGKEAWKKVNSIIFTGSIMVQGMEISVVATFVHQKGTRQDISMGGMSGYSILTPTEGWSFMPFGGQQKPEALTPDQVKNGQDQLDIQGELIDYKAKGHVAEYLGKEDVEGTECFKVKLTLKSGVIKTLFFDPSTYYQIREVQKTTSDGKEVESTVNYSNFQKLPEGIVVPMSIGTPGGDVTFKKIEVNTKIDDSIFKKS